MKESYLYVCEAKSLISATPLMRVENFGQADIVRAYLKKMFPKMSVSYFSTDEFITEVPHFSDYTWN